MGTGEGIAVIIPSWQEGARLLDALRAAREAVGNGEFVIVAFDESQDIREAARAEGVTWLDAPEANRGLQLAMGAARARGNILAFLHADTRLPAHAGPLMERAVTVDGVAGGAFRLRFDRTHPVLDGLAWMSRMTVPSAFLGDQCLFCTRAAYVAAGGFRPQPLFEDVDLARRLARVGRLVRLRQAVTTSARRFVDRGPIRQLATNALLLAAYHAGVDPLRLRAIYQPTAPAAATTDHPRHRQDQRGIADRRPGIHVGRRSEA